MLDAQALQLYLRCKAQGESGKRPPQYRSHHDVVNDWRGHHLLAPPRGYQWVQNGSDYLPIGLATGVIASMVLGSY